MSQLSDLKVALVHDWLYGGGAEKVVYELHQMFPDAPIYTSYCSDEWRQKLDNKVVTGYLQKWPFSQLRKFLPLLRQHWFRNLDLSGYDLVISSSGNGEAKFVRVKKPAVHVCYCHTPTHFYWRHFDTYYKTPSFKPYWLVRLGMKLLVGPLRRSDYEAAQKVDYFIANSTHIKNDIKEFYGRDATVVFPPVNIERFIQKSEATKKGFVTVGRLVPHKHNDIIVQACSELGLDLTIVGRGPDLERLQNLAGPTVTFVTNASDEEVASYLAGAEAFLFASFEDFGITPVEAMAAGTPVIAYKAGGALDYVVPGKTGIFFEEQTVQSLTTALQAFNPKDYSSADIKKAATAFSTEHFRKNLEQAINTALK